MTGSYLPHEAVVVVRLNFARVDNFTGERSVASRPWNYFVTATEHAVVHSAAKRLLAQFQTYTVTITLNYILTWPK